MEKNKKDKNIDIKSVKWIGISNSVKNQLNLSNEERLIQLIEINTNKLKKMENNQRALSLYEDIKRTKQNKYECDKYDKLKKDIMKIKQFIENKKKILNH